MKKVFLIVSAVAWVASAIRHRGTAKTNSDKTRHRTDVPLRFHKPPCP